ncbi:MAG: uncharacterized protein JWN44_1815 [Myxococcales bacterium]|nr:uncharacterized protein [Myxococcales bacterium]
MAKKSGLTLEAELGALSALVGDPRGEEARAALLAGLRSKRAPVAARAARLVREHRIDGLEAELKDAFDRFMRDPVKSDPGCQAKLAVLEALDYGESMDSAPFVRAVGHVQLEGAPDTAGGVRARGVLALARMGYADFDLIVAQLLTDRLTAVRHAALEGLAHRGDRAGAALAQLKISVGDDEPVVTLAAMSALLVLAPEWALAELRAIVGGKDAEARELAAVTLGQSRTDGALSVLLSALERCIRSEDREALLRGIGLHRSERALDAMLAVIAEAGPVDAKVAIESLVARRFEPGILARVRSATEANERAPLAALVDDVFRR